MSVLTFDTYKAVQTLIDKGVERKHAEGFTEVIQQAQEAHLEQLATKADIAGVRTEIVEVRGDLRLVKWMLAIVIAAQVLPLLKQLL